MIVPDGVLFGSTKAHKELRRILVEDQKLDGIVSLPSGVFKPYAGVSTAILLFTKTNSGGTDHVWFYDLQADGYSLDDKRTPLLPADKLGATPAEALTDDEHAKNNLPDALARWAERNGAEREPARTDQSFCVPKADIVANGYDLSINRYKEIVHDEVEHRDPREILKELDRPGGRDPPGPRRPRGDAVMTSWPDGALGESVELRGGTPSRRMAAPERRPVRYGSRAASCREARHSGASLSERPVGCCKNRREGRRPASRSSPIGGKPSTSRVTRRRISDRRGLVIPTATDVELASAYVAASSFESDASERLLQRVSGRCREHQPYEYYCDLPIPLPPIEEQRRIAAILDQADELRAKRRTSLALLDSLTESIFLDMFGDPARIADVRPWRRSRLRWPRWSPTASSRQVSTPTRDVERRVRSAGRWRTGRVRRSARRIPDATGRLTSDAGARAR